MAYRIQFSPAARRQFRDLPKQVQRRAAARIDSLAKEPRPAGAIKLSGQVELWRIRIGDYRLIYEVEDDRLLVLLIKIGHRRDIYRGL